MNNKEFLEEFNRLPEPWQMLEEILDRAGSWRKAAKKMNMPTGTLYAVYTRQRYPSYQVYRAIIFYFLANF